MVRSDKAAAVAELADAFRDSTAAVLTEYRGLTVAQLKTLRRSLAGNATYSVVKNTLSKIAARQAGVDAFESLLEGPSAIAFVSGDPVEVARGLRDFGRDHPSLVIKGGVLDGKALSADEVRRLAELESREVLLAKLAGGLQAPAQQLASVLAAPVAQLARLLGALAAKAAEDPGILAGGSTATPDPTAAPAAEPTAAAAPEPAPADLPDSAAPDADLPTDGTPGVEATPTDPVAEATGDDGGTAQAVADATDVPPATDVADGATSTS